MNFGLPSYHRAPEATAVQPPTVISMPVANVCIELERSAAILLSPRGRYLASASQVRVLAGLLARYQCNADLAAMLLALANSLERDDILRRRVNVTPFNRDFVPPEPPRMPPIPSGIPKGMAISIPPPNQWPYAPTTAR